MRRRACRRVRAEGLQQAGIVRSDRRSRGVGKITGEELRRRDEGSTTGSGLGDDGSVLM
ncbi:valine--tRNA ligase, mitochondrial 1 isoform X3 [Iris pallida]|uniref:Valine--tRNA ligase, mitochondrial 1 isoform X3 n=1 Tax=Iris pallida TaxID=29817 RepID=A0AAX6FCT3_IRIPA|nr:valine--tRNA ligase, mitochondrial 1 isoform X3 [Iris pallida]